VYLFPFSSIQLRRTRKFYRKRPARKRTGHTGSWWTGLGRTWLDEFSAPPDTGFGHFEGGVKNWPYGWITNGGKFVTENSYYSKLNYTKFPYQLSHMSTRTVQLFSQKSNNMSTNNGRTYSSEMPELATCLRPSDHSAAFEQFLPDDRRDTGNNSERIKPAARGRYLRHRRSRASRKGT